MNMQGGVSRTIGKVADKSGKLIGGVYNKLMMPMMIVGSLVVVMLVLKK